MFSEATYQAAIAVADTIETHFAHHLATARMRGVTELTPEPKAKAIESIIDATFWASLQREEGHSPNISLALLPPDLAGDPLIFERRLSLTPYNLTKLAPAVKRPGVHLGVWYDDDHLYVWGTTSVLPRVCLVLEVIEPGLLVIKHRRIDGFGKFVNIAVLKGDQVKVVDEQSSSLSDCPALLNSLLGMPLPSFLSDSVNVLVELATSMREHGRGGILLIVPTESKTWSDSIVHPISYPIVPAFTGIKDLMSVDIDSKKNQLLWQESLRRMVDIVGGFTAVDGATVINQDHELLAFGAKITRSEDGRSIEQLITTEPVVGASPVIIHPSQNGGTRHLSAAQFVYDQRDSMAMVASQDGRFTIFAWSPVLEMVHAHRIDVLLL